MAGMFGSIGRYLSNPDNIANIGATMKDVGANLNGEDGNNVLTVQKAVQDRKAKAAKDAFAQQLAGLIGGQNPGAATGSVAGGGFMSQDALPKVQAPPPGAISESLPSGGGRLNANSPELPGLVMAAQNAGYSMDDVLKVLQMQQPDARYDRGFGYNGKTGAPMAGFHPDVGEGRVATMDGQGNPTGVNNLPGYTNAIGQVEAAKAAAQAGFAPVQSHDQYGRPVTTTALQISGNPMVGSTPAQDAFDQASGTAAGQASQQARDAGMKANQTLDLLGQAENLLNGGNVITGFGAEQRLGAERAAATLLKDPKASARVADTETYQNLVNRQVLPLLKQMGSSNSITDTDREFIKGIVGGSITLNPETMRRVIEIGKREAGRTQQNSTAYGRPAAPGALRSGGSSGYSVVGVRRAGQ